ncbi:hypothetical protein CMUS01_12254 [Colletotrichum musicola]|uniref:Uncharacterized protein n=1 Tax=Colletotrichum musicola TaxID=2175873 RepID=A0A8H6JPM0_9PEZI|nr:hypothetical protein CMUS01_12254 [Colletotrichum musicola]
MFRLKAATPRYARLLLAGSLPLVSATPALKLAAAAPTGKRTAIMFRPAKVSKFERARRERDAEERKRKHQEELDRLLKENNQSNVDKRPLSDFEAAFKRTGRRHGNPKEMQRIYNDYLERLSQRDNNPNWQEYFMLENKVTPAALHEMATLSEGFPKMTRSELSLMFDMLNSAAALGYGPSALSCAKGLLLIHTRHGMRYNYWDPSWQPTRTLVEKLIKENRDAHACVVQGLIYYRTGDDDLNTQRALAAFKRAELLSQDAAQFEWHETLYTKQAELYQRLGDEDAAVEAMEKLVGWDYALGHYRLAMMCPDDPERYILLVKAAMSGLSKAIEPLMLHCLNESQRVAAADPRLAAEWRLNAEEWGRLDQYMKERDKKWMEERKRREEMTRKRIEEQAESKK